MHKGVILLTKASTAEIARNNVDEFMESHENSVWDWWQVGGRWSGQLNGYDPYEDPKNKKECWLCNGTGLREDLVGRQAREIDPDYTCNGCQGTGKQTVHPGEFHDTSGDNIPLADCIEKVKEWEQNPVESGKEKEAAAKEWLKGGERSPDKDHWSMYGYNLGIAAKFYGEYFHFDCNVFNIDKDNYNIPSVTAGWQAVIIDMHN